ncbi:MAG: hypothetical protein NVS2B12_41550 [Ktedonobacteraceae bacterium]
MALEHIPTSFNPWKVSLGASDKETLDMKLTSDDDGNLTGTLANSKVFGHWDPDAAKVTFLRLQDPSDPKSAQVFTGYLSSHVQGIDQIEFTLIGTYQVFAGAGVTAQNNVFGWTAFMSRIA